MPSHSCHSRAIGWVLAGSQDITSSNSLPPPRAPGSRHPVPRLDGWRLRPHGEVAPTVPWLVSTWTGMWASAAGPRGTSPGAFPEGRGRTSVPSLPSPYSKTCQTAPPHGRHAGPGRHCDLSACPPSACSPPTPTGPRRPQADPSSSTALQSGRPRLPVTFSPCVLSQVWGMSST